MLRRAFFATTGSLLATLGLSAKPTVIPMTILQKND